MDIAELIEPDRVVLGLRAADKPQVIEDLAERAATRLGIVGNLILHALAAREAPGSTGVGAGIAVPHARVPGLTRLFGLFARLKRPIDDDAVDEQPVDRVFMLLTPAVAGNDHLAALAAVSRRPRDRSVADRLRAATDERQLYAALAGTPPDPKA
jgi:nitrogen PTS system EIIA component